MSKVPPKQQRSGNWVLAAMIFAVGMTFIDMTIVSIAAPDLQGDLNLTDTGLQWVINGYLLALAASFALGGRLSDTLGHTRMVTIGVITFVVASAFCGFTPNSGIAEAWIIFFRVIQGVGAALMIPAALALVISSFSFNERGRALALFFGITGALTSVGPIAGGYLTEITWRAIFWINIPIAIIALVLIYISRHEDERTPAPIDYRGAVLITAGMALSVLGLQQASEWGWGDWKTISSIALGTVLIVVFVLHELKSKIPLMRVRIFTDRAFAAENVVLFLLMIVFIPLFFFCSTYSQISLGYSASSAGLYILTFFAGFATSAQIGGRILDKVGAWPAVVAGAAIATVGFYFWSQSLIDLDYSTQWYWIVISGAGMGMILGPANTDAINRAPKTSYGEATGITQTVRNYGSSLGLAVLGTILITENTNNVESALGKLGLPQGVADRIASDLSNSGGRPTGAGTSGGGDRAKAILHSVEQAYAQSTETIFLIMTCVLAAIFVFSLFFLPRGKLDQAVDAGKFDK
jgi:EmrB/QacA subfamily drug resistance transporter